MQCVCVCVCFLDYDVAAKNLSASHFTAAPGDTELTAENRRKRKKATNAYGGSERVPLCVYGARVQNTGNKQKRMHNRLSCASAGSIIHSVHTAADRRSSRRQNKYQYFQFKSSNGAQRAQLSLNAKKKNINQRPGRPPLLPRGHHLLLHG